ncbi:hypothetical protein ACFXJ8_26710 [Nonomuraea sp. NPDC059194]|uniref:hypothetical protein n=1 Tax=Nonomuraea sp. NPDC059194 TaxID=3346764 RepID=UPI003697EB39
MLAEGARFREAITPLVEALIAGQQLPEYAQDLIGANVDLLRRAYGGDTDGGSENFRELARQDVPDWMKLPPAAAED